MQANKMTCELCNQYNKLFSFHDIGSKIQEFFGNPHVPDDVMEHSKHVEINYKKIEYKHEEEISVEINFICADQNLIHTIIIENHTDMDEVKSDFNYNAMVNVISVINELHLEIHFKGENHIRWGACEIIDIDPDEVLVYSLDNSLSVIYMAVY